MFLKHTRFFLPRTSAKHIICTLLKCLGTLYALGAWLFCLYFPCDFSFILLTSYTSSLDTSSIFNRKFSRAKRLVSFSNQSHVTLKTAYILGYSILPRLPSALRALRKLGMALSVTYYFICEKVRADRQPFSHICGKMLIPFVASFSDFMN